MVRSFLLLLLFLLPHSIPAQVKTRQDPFSPFTMQVANGPTVALVLSGGGSRGIFQVGVLKAIEEAGIPVDMIVGTSMGSIVGGLYAAGYSIGELDSLARNLDWNQLLSLEGDYQRSDVFLDYKSLYDRTQITLELENWRPRIPTAVISGQKLTTRLNDLTLAGPYYPASTFRKLRVPFYSVSTNLKNGKKYIFSEGNLVEAMRSSMAFPLLFLAYELDGNQLIDGGVLSNIPVDVAREAGADIVITANTTGSLNTEEVKAPWQTVDRVTSIMMKLSNQIQLSRSDVVISMSLDEIEGFDFTRVDTVIQDGYLQAAKVTGLIDTLIRARTLRAGPPVDRIVVPPVLQNLVSDSLPETGTPLQSVIRKLSSSGWVHRYDVTGSDSGTVVTLVPFPVIQAFSFHGVNLLPARWFQNRFDALTNQPVNYFELLSTLRSVVSTYKKSGFYLARIDSFRYEPETGRLHTYINEGVISDVAVTGNKVTRKSYITREASLDRRALFHREEIKSSLDNLTATDLFYQASLLTDQTARGNRITFRVHEKPSLFLRAGISATETYNTQYFLNLRNENMLGEGSKLGMTLAGGDRNGQISGQWRTDRLLDSYFSSEVTIWADILNVTVNSYRFSVPGSGNRSGFSERGEFQRESAGLRTMIGRQFAKFGEIRLDLHRKYSAISLLRGLSNDATFSNAGNHLNILRLQTVFDNRDSPVISTGGQFLDFYYETSNTEFGSDVSYSKMAARLETTFPFLPRVTLTPRMELGSADIGLPVQEFFYAGGGRSFYGFRDFDLYGRQLMMSHLEMRWYTPTTFIFDVILHARYDLGNAWQRIEAIKVSQMNHGVGGGITLSTPLGPISLSAGRAFKLYKEPNAGIGWGPLFFYFSLGNPTLSLF